TRTLALGDGPPHPLQGGAGIANLLVADERGGTLDGVSVAQHVGHQLVVDRARCEVAGARDEATRSLVELLTEDTYQLGGVQVQRPQLLLPSYIGTGGLNLNVANRVDHARHSRCRATPTRWWQGALTRCHMRPG